MTGGDRRIRRSYDDQPSAINCNEDKMASVVNPAWMQPVHMKRIIAHWSAGMHRASDLDKEHYHIIVEADGRLVRGDHDISDNLTTADDDYAAHTRGCNTGSI